ncbi:hypothetical protein BSL78_11912 [Apostichopus japonicus]|uniref:Reverse transcriptase domain-containing protein n=1 Tax=Stichopus japonicus TaxID=307972 RepID=A0A2G8JUQ0_STIJA|nr:hypothetical protein BSL78_23737 [Apostichopus japonicus]PIK51195.1 hypothetical protein BSL78_11912 [Apostichopus japonicus]
MTEIFSELSNDKYFSRIDLTKGYWQVEMTQSAKEKTAFVTPDGLWQFKTMPFGLVGAPAVFTRLMRTILRDVPNVVNYLDDILIHTETWDEHVECLELLFQTLRESGLTARPSKCEIGFTKLSSWATQLETGSWARSRVPLIKSKTLQNPRRKPSQVVSWSHGVLQRLYTKLLCTSCPTVGPDEEGFTQ